MGASFDPVRVRLLLDMLRPERRLRVLDIGANPLGDTPYKGLLQMGACEVWGFEPQPDAYADLIAQAGPLEHYLCAAVGDGQPAQLHICGTSTGFTSTLQPDARLSGFLGHLGPEMTVTETAEIQTTRLDDLDLPVMDLIKIDIQGGEKAAFENGRGVLSGALAVITEVAFQDIYVDQPLVDAQMRCLRESGYEMHKLLFLKHALLTSKSGARLSNLYASQILDGDAVLVRGLRDWRKLDDAALGRLALMADAVFESFDLSVAVLDELLHRKRVPGDLVARYTARVLRVNRFRRKPEGTKTWRISA